MGSRDKTDFSNSVLGHEKEYEYLFRKSPLGIIFYDKNGNLIKANESALEIMAIPKLDDILGSNLFDNPYIMNKKEEISKKGVIEFQAPLDLDLMKKLGFYTPVKKGTLSIYYRVSVYDQGYLVQIHNITDLKNINEINKSEKKFRAIFDSMNESFMLSQLIWDKNGKPFDWKYISVNRAATSAYGMKPEMIENKTFREVFPDMEPPNLQMIADAVSNNKIIKNGEFYSQLTKQWLEVDVYPQNEDNFAVFTRDITKRKLAEKAIKESEEKYRLIVETTNEGIWEMDNQFVTMHVNSAMAAMVGYTPQEMIGKPVPKFLFKEDLEDHADRMGKRKKGTHGKYECRLKHRDGSIKWALVSATPKKDINDKFTGSFAMFVDITQRKKLEEKLKESYNDLELKIQKRTKEIEYQANLLENVNDAIIATDNEFNITSWNNAAEKIYGWKSEEVLGKDSTPILQIEFYDSNSEEMIQSIVKKGSFKGETIHHKKDGTPIFIDSTVVEMKDSNDNVRGWVAVNRDISRRKKYEKELEKIIEELKRSNEELEHFAYVASHDLQEPLRTIASFTQLLEYRYKNKLDSDADEFMDYIVEAAKRMKDQIEGLLEYSRVATKGEDFKLVDLNEILDITLQNLYTLIKESKAKIIFDNLPSVWGDEGQLERVFQNIISNAIKFRKLEEPLIINVVYNISEDNKEYVFSIKDNGIGIEEEYLDRIFTIFQRLHTRDVYDGTGIGLSIVKRIAERHGGRIWVESSFGKGSTFYFTLPIFDN